MATIENDPALPAKTVLAQSYSRSHNDPQSVLRATGCRSTVRATVAHKSESHSNGKTNLREIVPPQFLLPDFYSLQRSRERSQPQVSCRRPFPILPAPKPAT